MRYVSRNSSMLACQLIVNTTKEKCLEVSSESVTWSQSKLFHMTGSLTAKHRSSLFVELKVNLCRLIASVVSCRLAVVQVHCSQSMQTLEHQNGCFKLELFKLLNLYMLRLHGTVNGHNVYDLWGRCECSLPRHQSIRQHQSAQQGLFIYL